ncbi:GrpB family protein [Williamsia soli]|uniref:GrpB family protein n=1 Tax=Williamsia soli TaxID=364929 RepID=UPI001A9CC0E2|nr:GrpB family protein [Williamsia soli]
MDPGVELIGGIEQRAIVLVPYEPAWPADFAREQRRIESALGEAAIRIDHIGSTSIPGLSAKPIIDINLTVRDPDDEVAYLPALESAGYRLRVREPGHRMVRTPELDVHVHVCAPGSDWQRRHLLFRDWLRHNVADRATYEALKKCLAAQEWSDMNEYAAAKGPLIGEITDRAEQWAQRTGWRV